MQSSSPAVPLFSCPVHKMVVGKPMERVPDHNKAFALCWNGVLMISVFSSARCLPFTGKYNLKHGLFEEPQKPIICERVIKFSLLKAYWMYT